MEKELEIMEQNSEAILVTIREELRKQTAQVLFSV